jgi:hypothetical protein
MKVTAGIIALCILMGIFLSGLAWAIVKLIIDLNKKKVNGR